MKYILIIGAIQAVLLSVFLWRNTKIDKRITANLSGLLILSATVLLGKAISDPETLSKLGNVSNPAEFMKKYAPYITMTDALLFLFGPVSYFLTRSILKLKKQSRRIILLHYLPAIIYLFIFNTIIAVMILGKFEGYGLRNVYKTFVFIELAGIISCGAYLFASIRAVQKYKNYFLNQFASPGYPVFLKHFFVTSLVLTSFWFIGFVLNNLRISPAIFAGNLYVTFWILISVSIYLLSYYVMSTPEIVSIPEFINVENPEENSNKKENNEIVEIQKQELQTFLINEKPHLNPELNLNKLSELTGIKRHDLSAAINTGFKMNFFDLINHYRIKEFLDVYQDASASGKQISFIEIAYQVGFNSKSVFNRAFKKYTGTTPSQYFKLKQVA